MIRATRPALCAAILLSILGQPILAAEIGPNGGQVRVIEGHPIEFVASEAALTFFLNDHDGQPLSTEGMSAKAFVSVDGRTRTLPLDSAAPNRLVAALPAPLGAGAKVVLSVKGHGHTMQARFER